MKATISAHFDGQVIVPDESNLEEAFADTSFWDALVVKQDPCHARAQMWTASLLSSGKIAA